MKPIVFIMKSIPVLAPIPAMWSVYAAATHKLHWPVPVAAAGALAVEGLGFASVNLAERMHTYNKNLRMDERTQKWEAPTWQAIAATVLYLAVVLAMITLIDIVPNITAYLPIAFPVLGVTGAAVWAIQSGQDERERIVSEYRAKKKDNRKQVSKKGVQVAGKKSSKGDKLQVQGKKLAGASSKQDPQVAGKQPVQDESLLAHWRDNPQASDGKVAAHFGTSRQAIQQRREKLIRQGEIRMGAQGVEIIGIRVDMSAGAGK